MYKSAFVTAQLQGGKTGSLPYKMRKMRLVVKIKCMRYLRHRFNGRT